MADNSSFRRCACSGGKRIISIKCAAQTTLTAMLAAEHYPYHGVARPNHELLEVHRSKISIHHAKAGYDYPAIRLPFTLSGLAGLPTRIYQTVHDGALALLVVSSSHKGEERRAQKSENFAISSRHSYLHGGNQAFQSLRAHLFF